MLGCPMSTGGPESTSAMPESLPAPPSLSPAFVVPVVLPPHAGEASAKKEPAKAASRMREGVIEDEERTFKWFDFTMTALQQNRAQRKIALFLRYFVRTACNL